MRGLDRTGTMLEAVTHALPKLGVDSKRCDAALAGGALATDEVMRRVEAGRPFRTAYREVAAALKEGESFDPPPRARIISRRSSTGGLGNLGLPDLKRRLRLSRSWNARERKRFDRAMIKLAGPSARAAVRRSARPS
jgi:argininosuccinate lyase